MLIQRLIEMQMMKMAEEKADDGGAVGGAPADTDGSSDDDTEFSEIVDTIDEEDSEKATDEGGAEESEGKVEEEAGSDADDADPADEDADADDDEDADKSDEEEDEDGDDETVKEHTPEEVAAMRSEYIDQFAERFKLSEEDAEAFRTEPETVLPKMMAKVHTETVEMMTNIMRANLPQLVRQQLDYAQKSTSVEQQFYSKFADLDTPKGRKMVEQVAKTYRAANPKAKLEEAIEDIGYLAWKKMKLPMDRLGAQANDDEESFVASAKQGKDKGGYKPEKAGKVTPPERRQSSEEKSEFEDIAELFIQDDRGL